MNSVNLIGRTTKDIELKQTQNGKYYCQFTIAVNKSYGQDGANFINCVAWNKTAEFLAQYIKKGYLIAITNGSIQTRSYESNGRTNYVFEVLCENVKNLTPKQNNVQDTKSRAKCVQINALDAEPLTYNEVKIDSEELPFY